MGTTDIDRYRIHTRTRTCKFFVLIGLTRSDILQGQALFRGVKSLRRCLVMLNNFENFSFPSIEKRWTKDKETDGQKEKRQEKTKNKKRKSKKQRKSKRKKQNKNKKTKKQKQKQKNKNKKTKKNKKKQKQKQK